MYYVLLTIPGERGATLATRRGFRTLPEAEAYLASVHAGYAPFIVARLS